jgi:hypothetical protein
MWLITLAFAAAPNPCPAPSPARYVAEVKRLFVAAAEHASRSSVCSDGMGEQTKVEVLCVSGVPAALEVTYRVIVSQEYGGECTPYPDCATPPPPSVKEQKTQLRFVDAAEGQVLEAPAKLPGINLLTPLAKAHDGKCNGKKPPFKPTVVKPRA